MSNPGHSDAWEAKAAKPAAARLHGSHADALGIAFTLTLKPAGTSFIELTDMPPAFPKSNRPKEPYAYHDTIPRPEPFAPRTH